jgi:hypothetical protein
MASSDRVQRALDRGAARGAQTPLGMILEPEAGEELLAAATWYDDQRPGRPTASRGSRYVLTHDARMTRRNPQKRECSPFRLPAILFPVAKGVHADAERFGELGLRQADEPAQRRHITGLKLTPHDALTLAVAQGSREVGSAEFGDGLHDCFSMYSR